MNHPIDTIRWVPAESLEANDYNPNHVGPVELELLKLSILEDGWTQPVVVVGDKIVDGFHRWSLVLNDKEVRALSDGQVPVVQVAIDGDKSHQMMSTIRHNRARGKHVVIKMADIVVTLLESGMDGEEIQRRLGMEWEEVDRLYDRGNMRERASKPEFNNAWVPDDGTV